VEPGVRDRGVDREHGGVQLSVPAAALHAHSCGFTQQHFDRIVVPAPAGRDPGFTPKELLWLLTNAPSETVILRPDPALRATEDGATELTADSEHGWDLAA
jgi:hypothetical protein